MQWKGCWFKCQILLSLCAFSVPIYTLGITSRASSRGACLQTEVLGLLSSSPSTKSSTLCGGEGAIAGLKLEMGRGRNHLKHQRAGTPCLRVLHTGRSSVWDISLFSDLILELTAAEYIGLQNNDSSHPENPLVE